MIANSMLAIAIQYNDSFRIPMMFHAQYIVWQSSLLLYMSMLSLLASLAEHPYTPL